MPRIVLLLSLAVLVGCARQLVAQEVASPRQDAADALDAKLLENLDTDLFEGLDQPLPKSASPKSAPSLPAKDAPRVASPEERLRNAIGEDVGAPDTAADEENVLARIEQKMRDVERRLAQRDPSEATQQLQRQIAEELAALLEQLQQQQQQQQQNQNNNASRQPQPQPQSSPQSQQTQRPTSAANPSSAPAQQPARDSEERTGKLDEEKIRPDEIKDLIQGTWGHLPPQVRLRMEDAASEQFLPKYQTLIEDYFRRLAEERRP